MQETTFPVEIIVHDDASTDGTQDVVKSYTARHPFLFKLIFQKENLYTRGKRPSALALPHTTGEFITICEGDDYWTLPSKLQKQIEKFECNPACILCGGRVAIIREGRTTPYRIEPHQTPEILTTLGQREMLRGDWTMHTVSRMARRVTWLGYLESVKDSVVAGDFLFILYCISISHSRHGAFQCLDEVIGAYRENNDGVWFSKPASQKLSANIEALQFALKNFDFGNDVNIIEWIFLMYLRNSASGIRSRPKYIVLYLLYFIKRNMRKIHNVFRWLTNQLANFPRGRATSDNTKKPKAI